MTTGRPDPMPKLCHHDDPSWCNEECAEKARKFDEWVRRQVNKEPGDAVAERLEKLRKSR